MVWVGARGCALAFCFFVAHTPRGQDGNYAGKTGAATQEQRVQFITPHPGAPQQPKPKAGKLTQSTFGVQCSLKSDSKLTEAARELDRLRSQKQALAKQLRRLDKQIEQQVELIMDIVSNDPAVTETE